MEKNGAHNKGHDKRVSKKLSTGHNFLDDSDNDRDLQVNADGNNVSDGSDSTHQVPTRTEVSEETDKPTVITRDDITIINPDSDTTNQDNVKVREYRRPTRVINDLVTRKTAVLMIFTFLNAGITDRKEIRTVIESHGLLHTSNVRDGNTELFNRYIHEAEEMRTKDYGHTAWITSKIQTGFNEDYHDALEVLTTRIDHNKENRDFFQTWAKELIQKRSKSNDLLGVMSIINDLDKTVASLLKDRNAMIEGGPMMYKTKKYIDLVHEILESKGVHIDKNNMLPSGNVMENIDGSPRGRLGKEPEERSPMVNMDDQKEFRLAPHLQQIEKELGKKIIPDEDRS